MEDHFIESCEDEREVLCKIQELKKLGYNETGMYVVARTNEELTMIRTRTDVDFHSVEDKGMGRFGTVFRKHFLLPYLLESGDEVRAASELYQNLEEGKILLFSEMKENLCSLNPHTEENSAFMSPFRQKLPLNQRDGSEQENEVTIDAIHYETFNPSEAVPLRKADSNKR